MKILRITDLRNWAKENGYSDSWYYSIDGSIPTEKVKIGQVPREGNVNVLNADIKDPSEDDWIRFRYPDYETPDEIKEREEKIRIANLPSPAQIVALEFFGQKTEGIDRDQASDLLDDQFKKPYDLEKYRDYKWKNRHRIWEGKDLLVEWLRRFQDQEFYIRESVPGDKIFRIAEEAHNQGITETRLLEYLKNNHPSIFLAESTRKKKLNESNWGKSPSNYSSKPEPVRTSQSSNSGCLGVFVLFLLPAILVGITIKNMV